MKLKTVYLILCLTLLSFTSCMAENSANKAIGDSIIQTQTTFDLKHSLLQEVLNTHLESGLVDYASLKQNPNKLNEYLKSISSVDKKTFDSWDKTEQIAFLSNAYNAYTLKLIISHYPIKSIKDIGGIIKGPWKQKIVSLFGETTTLDHIEHGILRKNYNEARIHFALVCAAKSCPELSSNVFLSDTLDQHLDTLGENFLNRKDLNRIAESEKRIYLSPIFKWFRKDFESGGSSLADYSKKYFKSETDISNFKISFTDYDWSLNKQ